MGYQSRQIKWEMKGEEEKEAGGTQAWEPVAPSCFPWGGGTLVAHRKSCATIPGLLSPGGCWTKPTLPDSPVLPQNRSLGCRKAPGCPQGPTAAVPRAQHHQAH